MTAAELGQRAASGTVKRAFDIQEAIASLSDTDEKRRKNRKIRRTAKGGLIGGTAGYLAAPWLAMLAAKHGLGDYAEPFIENPSYGSAYGAAAGALLGGGLGALGN